MNSIIITPKSKSDITILKALAKKMGFDVAILSHEQKEEAGFLLAMLEARKSKLVPKSAILKTLRKK